MEWVLFFGILLVGTIILWDMYLCPRLRQSQEMREEEQQEWRARYAQRLREIQAREDARILAEMEKNGLPVTEERNN